MRAFNFPTISVIFFVQIGLAIINFESHCTFRFAGNVKKSCHGDKLLYAINIALSDLIYLYVQEFFIFILCHY